MLMSGRTFGARGGGRRLGWDGKEVRPVSLEGEGM